MPFDRSKLPAKIIGSGVLFFNERGELLIVKPNYRDGWLIPGGAVEKNESPLSAAVREVEEEIGLKLERNSLRFLAVDYKESDDAVQFNFYGGVLKPEEIEKIRLQKEELTDYKFVGVKKALGLLAPRLASRLPVLLIAIKNKKSFYLEDGVLFRSNS